MGQVRVLRQGGSEEDVRSRAEEEARFGSPASALALMTAAAEDVEASDPYAAAVLLAEGSWYARLAYGPDRALEVARGAERLAFGAEGVVAAIVHARLGDALQWNGRYRDAQPEWLRAAAAKLPPDPPLLALRTDALVRAGDLAAAREAAYATATRAREAGDRDALRDGLTYQVISEIHLGLLREADASAAELEAGAGGGASGDRAEALGLRAWIDALIHKDPTCNARIAEALATVAEIRVTAPQGMAAGLLGLRAGRYEEAVGHLETKLDGHSPLSAALSLRPFLDALVEASVRCGRRERAGRLVEEVFEPSVATGQPRFVAVALRMRALTAGDSSDFDLALDQHQRWGNRFEEARTRLVYGETLRREKKRAKAREQLSLAVSMFAAVGADDWARRGRAELRAAGARLARPASGAALTSQEDRVARLVTEGLSNKEIGALLYISTKTVEGHLRNIFEKLGITKRTQVARFLSREVSR